LRLLNEAKTQTPAAEEKSKEAQVFGLERKEKVVGATGFESAADEKVFGCGQGRNRTADTSPQSEGQEVISRGEL
jgi:hypothetical protein